MTEQRKFCKDCKHYLPVRGQGRCYHPMALDIVEGRPGYCEIHRRGPYEIHGYCGPSGRWHEIAPTPPAIIPMDLLGTEASSSTPWWKFWA